MTEEVVRLLRKFDLLLVAFSGGVDSTYLLALAVRELGRERVAALTAVSPTLPQRELAACRELAGTLGVELQLVESHELENPAFTRNDAHRCYHCKDELFTLCHAWIAGQPEPARWRIAYGANADDCNDQRPGMEAARRQGIHAPLLEAGLTKEAIRAGSRRLGLPTADKPAFACLSSRFPHAIAITPARLHQVEAAEELLRQAGFHQFRVRYQGETARVEVGHDELDRLHDAELRARLVAGIIATGFARVEVDWNGYRQGGANLPPPAG